MRKSSCLSLLAILGLAGQFWLSEATIAPQVAHAYTSRVDISLDNLPNEAFEVLLRRAEAAARAAAQRSFDRDILATQALVIVTAQNNGATAPILTLDVSRAQWKSRPETQRWATYYRPARTLLGFDRPGSTTAAPTPTTSTPANVSPTLPEQVPFPVTPGTTPGVVPTGTVPAPGSVPTPAATPGAAPTLAPSTIPSGNPTPNSPGTINPNLVAPGVPRIPSIQTAPTTPSTDPSGL